MKFRTIFFIAFLLVASPSWAWQEVANVPFVERGDQAGLLLSLDRQAKYLEALPPDAKVRVGNLSIANKELLRGARLLSRIVLESHGKEDFSRRVNESFRVFMTSHPQFAGKAHFTAYYDPIMEASKHPTGPYRFPIYARPPDLVEQSGRVLLALSGGGTRAYYTRREIEEQNVLSGRNLEIAWVKDYVELHFLHIQGSGVLRFTDGGAKTLHVSATNGHPFSSPGKMLIAAGLSSGNYQETKNYLRTHPDQARQFLTRNARFIFFRMDDQPPSGCAGVPITPGRTIATDKSIYSSGAIGYVRYDAPKLDAAGNLSGTVSTSRFVTDNDTGSAIVGSGRADLYVGNGPRAETLAGATNTKGELYYLIPR